MTDQQSPQAVECLPDSRKAFEAWESRLAFPESDLLDKCSEGAPRAGEYRSLRVQDDWEVWQAGRQEQALQYLSDQGQWIEETGRLRAELETYKRTNARLRDDLGDARRSRAAVREPAEGASERARFEAWMNAPAPRICSPGSPKEGEYESNHWQSLWEAWRAALSGAGPKGE